MYSILSNMKGIYTPLPTLQTYEKMIMKTNYVSAKNVFNILSFIIFTISLAIRVVRYNKI